MTLEQVMATYPNLGSFGFRPPSSEYLAADRIELIQTSDRVETIRTWIAQFPKTKEFNKRGTSYGLKHVAEKHLGYITNGQFIAAALLEGFDIQLCEPNAYLNISQRAWRS